MNTTTLQSSRSERERDGEIVEQEQYRLTVPKSLVEAMGWERGDKMNWEVESGNRVSISKDD